MIEPKLIPESVLRSLEEAAIAAARHVETHGGGALVRLDILVSDIDGDVTLDCRVKQEHYSQPVEVVVTVPPEQGR